MCFVRAVSRTNVGVGVGDLGGANQLHSCPMKICEGHANYVASPSFFLRVGCHERGTAFRATGEVTWMCFKNQCEIVSPVSTAAHLFSSLLSVLSGLRFPPSWPTDRRSGTLSRADVGTGVFLGAQGTPPLLCGGDVVEPSSLPPAELFLLSPKQMPFFNSWFTKHSKRDSIASKG